MEYGSFDVVKKTNDGRDLQRRYCASLVASCLQSVYFNYTIFIYFSLFIFLYLFFSSF
jgi:hypothetical protein